MRAVATKAQLLTDEGYLFNFDRVIYINRAARKVFSVEFVQDHDEAELEAAMHAPSLPSGEWQFFFNKAPSDTVKRDLSGVLG